MGVIYYLCVKFYSTIHRGGFNDCYVLEWVIDGAELMLLLLLLVFFFLR